MGDLLNLFPLVNCTDVTGRKFHELRTGTAPQQSGTARISKAGVPAPHNLTQHNHRNLFVAESFGGESPSGGP
ncbi:MAG: hypothetical protein JWQ87_1341 [Candidatus Sulfotelmatobacter sp.]|nr:hypothetical protein [Candidatus Sulfotelmatobacter sp.]